jgi:hypothetical protein
MTRNLTPKALAFDPTIFLKKGAERVLLVPQKGDITRVIELMFGQSNSIKTIGIVEPVDIRMRIVRITGTAIDLSILHRPQVRHDIDVVFGDVCAYLIDNRTINC